MPIDFGQLQHPKAMKRPVDPIELFQSVRVTDTAINDLWLAQGDALREWHKSRKREDILIQLNTGAGKTLVGLLAAQSLVNEPMDTSYTSAALFSLSNRPPIMHS